MWPPHASPTEKATSSVTPNAASLGLPAFNTFCASSNTAPSMHPFDTEPAILPDLVTAIFEPSGRGLDPHVSTTVASAISSPASLHAFNSSRTSRIATSELRDCRGRLEGARGHRALARYARPGSRRSMEAPPPYRASGADSPPSPAAG